MEGKAYSDEGKPFQSPGRMKNSSYYIAPAGDWTHDLPLTVGQHDQGVLPANHSATAAVMHQQLSVGPLFQILSSSSPEIENTQ